MSFGLHIHQLSYQFSSQSQLIFDSLSFDLLPGKWSSILGKSGCGKTTLLKLIAGFLDQQGKKTGEIFTTDSSGTKQEVTSIAYMGQQDLLFPWLSVLKNVCLESYLQTGKISKQEQQKARQLLQKLDLIDYQHKLPNVLSGGMKQRVALARTLIQDKDIILMDEPFSAVDAVTRYQLQTLAYQLLKDKTVLLITHDPQEALRLSQKIMILNQGKVIDFDYRDSDLLPRELDQDFLIAQNALIQLLTNLGTDND